jgi:hypothetical protein
VAALFEFGWGFAELELLVVLCCRQLLIGCVCVFASLFPVDCIGF